MTDWLVEVQKAVAAYPSWLVVGAGVVVLAAVLLIIGKLFRAAAVLLLVGGVGGACWMAWRHLFS